MARRKETEETKKLRGLLAASFAGGCEEHGVSDEALPVYVAGWEEEGEKSFDPLNEV
jgi:hypothetical protein